MDLSLSKLPWYGQLSAFVVVGAGAVFGFWYVHASEVQADMSVRETRLATMRADIGKGVATAKQLPRFQAQVDELETRLDSLRQILPEEKDVADTLRRIQTLATKSNLTIQRFQPGKIGQQKLYAEIPYKLQAQGTYHSLGAFFDQISRFPRIINVSAISIRAKEPPEPNKTVVAELVATTFVLQDAGADKANNVPKQPSLQQ